MREAAEYDARQRLSSGFTLMALLSVRGLWLRLPDRTRQTLLRRAPKIDILKHIDLDLEPGESLGIVGESGSGKTSLARTLLRLYEPSAGQLVFDGQDITHRTADELRPMREQIQMIFQDPTVRRSIPDIASTTFWRSRCSRSHA